MAVFVRNARAAPYASATVHQRIATPELRKSVLYELPMRASGLAVRRFQSTAELRVEALAAGKISNAWIVGACRGNDAFAEIGETDVQHFHEIDQVLLTPQSESIMRTPMHATACAGRKDSIPAAVRMTACRE